MNFKNQHSWDLTISEAKNLQNELARKVIRANDISKVSYVGGVDVGFDLKRNKTLAAVVILSFPDLEIAESSLVIEDTRFPYIPGLLSFREAPSILKALERLNQIPDVILCDGQGIAHPRRLGIASHIGVITGIPTIGVAKSRLIGQHGDVPNEKGQLVELTDADEIIGAVLRTRKNVKPLYVSIGHKVDLINAIRIVLDCITKYRLPETTRQAHKLASE
jgi:deoxyribonuclease V